MANISLDFLKKNKESLLKKNQESFKEKTTRKDDDGFFKPTFDKAGNATVVMRFLPTAKSDYEALGEDTKNIAELYSYGFKNKDNGRWYINPSPSTIKLPDPMMDYNKLLWDAGLESKARSQKRRLQYIVNVLIVKDKNNPASEGNVYKFSFGKKIYDKLKAATNPPEELGEEPIDIYDLWNAPNFNLIVTKEKVEINGNSVEVPNYDQSAFSNRATPVAGSDEEIEAIWNRTHALGCYVDPAFYPTEEAIFKDIARVFGDDVVRQIKEKTLESVPASVRAQGQQMDDDLPDFGGSESKLDTDIKADEVDNGDIDDILAGI